MAPSLICVPRLGKDGGEGVHLGFNLWTLLVDQSISPYSFHSCLEQEKPAGLLLAEYSSFRMGRGGMEQIAVGCKPELFWRNRFAGNQLSGYLYQQETVVAFSHAVGRKKIVPLMAAFLTDYLEDQVEEGMGLLYDPLGLAKELWEVHGAYCSLLRRCPMGKANGAIWPLREKVESMFFPTTLL